MQDTQKRMTAVAFGLLLSLTTLGSSAFASNGPGAPAGSEEVAAKADSKPAGDEVPKAGDAAQAAGQLAELSEGEMQDVTGKHIVIRRGKWEVHLTGPRVCAPIVGCVTVHRHPRR